MDECTTQPGKTCSSCAEWKPLSQFHKGAGYRDGYTGQCKACRNKVISEWAKAHRDQRGQSQVKWYAKHGTEYHREWREANAGNHKAVRRRYRSRPEVIEASRLGVNRRRAAATGASGSHTVEEWLNLLAMFNSRCVACGSADDIVRDHIVPLSLQGADSIDNLQPLCRSCNTRKGQRSIDYRSSPAVSGA